MIPALPRNIDAKKDFPGILCSMSTQKENGDRWWTRLFDRLNNLAYQKLPAHASPNGRSEAPTRRMMGLN